MIVILTTAMHRWPIRGLCKNGKVTVKTLSYERAFLSPLLPRASYIFTDFERLSVWELELAAELYRSVRDKGMRVLNDPVRFLPRLTLLQRLHKAGINDFRARPAVQADDVDRFPVFLRHEAAHRGVLSGLLRDKTALQAELRSKQEGGLPLRDLMIVEYAAQADDNGIFHKWSMYRVGEHIVPCAGAFDSDWCAKFGVNGIAGDAAYQAELQAVRENHHAEEIKQVFELSGMEFGRIDFSLVDGKVQIYEINTNPTIINPAKTIRDKGHPSEYRLETYALVHQRLIDALASQDEGRWGWFLVRGDKLDAQKKHRLRRPFTRWMP